MNQIKIKHNQKCFIWRLPTAELSNLHQFIHNKIKLDKDSYELEYIDSDNDTIVITDDDDLKQAITSEVQYIYITQEECNEEKKAMHHIKSIAPQKFEKEKQFDKNKGYDSFMNLNCNITDTELQQLNQFGCFSVEDLVFDIININNQFKGKKDCLFSDTRFQDIYFSARSYVEQSCLNKINITKAQTKQVILISTGCPTLDEALGGGIRPSVITQVHGGPRTGKTALCLQISCLAQKAVDYSGGGGGVIFWDIESTFRKKAINEISCENNMNPREVLNNISYTRSHTPEFIQTIEKLFAHTNYCLLIIDSITGLFKINANNRKEQEMKLCTFLYHLTQICYYNKTSIVVTSQKSEDKNDQYSYYHIFSNLRNAYSQQILMRKDKTTKNKTHFKLSGCLSTEKEACFFVTPKGIKD
eukprot:530793_1